MSPLNTLFFVFQWFSTHLTRTRVRSSLKEGMESLRDWMVSRFVSLPSPRSAQEMSIPAIIKALDPQALETMTSEEAHRLLQKTRTTLQGYGATHFPSSIGSSLRKKGASSLQKPVSYLLSIHIHALSKLRLAPTSAFRVLRTCTMLLSATLESIYSTRELCEDIKKDTASSRSDPTRMLNLKLLRQRESLLHEAFRCGLPKIWVPLHRTLERYEMFGPQSQEGPKDQEVSTVQPLGDESMIQFMRNTLFMSMPTRQRHLRIIEQQAPALMKHFLSTTQDSVEGHAARTSVMLVLSEAASPASYHAWLKTWSKKGMRFDVDEMWSFSSLPHKVPSAYACVTHYNKEALSACLVGIDVDGKPHAFFSPLATSPFHLPTSSVSKYTLRLIGIANYVLPLLFEGPAFLKEADITGKDLDTVAPIVEGLYQTPGQEACALPPYMPWTPWQHLAAYLAITPLKENYAPAPPLHVLEERLRFFEELWGPPCTQEGGVAAFFAWYQKLIPLRITPLEGEQSYEWEEVRLVWQRFLDHHVLRITLEDAAPHTPSGVSEPGPIPVSSSRRRRL